MAMRRNGLVQQLDDLPGESYTASIRFLIADHKTNGEETDELERVLNTVEEVEKRTGRMEQTLEELAEGRR